MTPARPPERAVVLAVDDAPDDLARLRTELSKRYGDDYDVRVAASPGAALSELEDLRAAQLPVALVLASQWMAEMRGTELLRRAGELHPTAKRGLLISWGDRSVADPILEAMATGRFDHYVPKPMTAPDEGFHSVVQGFLADWATAHSRGFTPIVVVGDLDSPRLHEFRDLMTRNGLVHQLHAPDSVEGAALLSRGSRGWRGSAPCVRARPGTARRSLERTARRRSWSQHRAAGG